MMIENSKTRYSTLVVALHWLMLLLIVAVYACMELRGWVPKTNPLRASLKPLHFMLGLTVLVLVTVRLVARARAGAAPGIRPLLPPWQSRLSQALHIALYAFMIAMPLLGWLALSAAGLPIPFFGLQVPALIGPDAALAERIKDVHETLATVGYFLIGLHACAGLWHHYGRRDNTLVRMLPAGWSRDRHGQ